MIQPAGTSSAGIGSCLAILLVFASASAAEPETKSKTAELAEQLKARKIERFFSTIEKNEAIPADLKARVLKLKEGATLGGEFGCIHQSLLILDEDYKRADALLLNERFAGAAELLERIRKTEDKYVAGYATYRLGLAEINRERYEQAVEAFTEVLNKHRAVGCDIECAFYLAVALGQSRQKEKALVSAKRFLEDYPDAPERYRNAAEQMLKELMQDWESPLYDLASRMNHVGRLIESGETGERPQGEQGEIVSILDELIKKAEDNEGNGQGGGGGGGGGPPKGNQTPNGPAGQSTLPPGASRVGDMRGRKKAKAGEKWGDMRDKEREEVLQALKDKFPERFRELQKYYEIALAKQKRVTETDEDTGADEE